MGSEGNEAGLIDELRRERSLISCAMDASPAGIVILNPVGDIVFANRFAEEALGIGADNDVDSARASHAMKGDRERCIEAGMDDYVSKPVRPEELIEAVSAHLSAQLEPGEGQLVGAPDPAEEIPSEEIPSEEIPSEELFDPCALLERLGGDGDLWRELLSEFVTDVASKVDVICETASTGDQETVRREGHSITGASATVGAKALSAVGFEIECAGKDGRLDDVPALLDQLKTNITKLRRILLEHGIGARM